MTASSSCQFLHVAPGEFDHCAVSASFSVGRVRRTIRVDCHIVIVITLSEVCTTIEADDADVRKGLPDCWHVHYFVSQFVLAHERSV